MRYNTRSSEQGFVAIIVATMIMIILSLITIGFTRLMQREQRQALDRQLSRQALYAAESGINDIYDGIVSNPNLPEEKLSCDVLADVGGEPNPAVNGGLLEPNGDVAYTCALYDKAPTEFNAVIAKSKSIELINESGNDFETITVSWGNETKGSPDNDVAELPSCSSSTALDFPTSRNDRIPVMNISLTNTDTYERNTLISNTTNVYLVPCREAGGQIDGDVVPIVQSGQVIPVECQAVSEEVPCTYTFRVTGSPKFLFNILPLYTSAQVRVNGTELGGDAVEFQDLQTEIDVTARAADVVRRLRVSISTDNSADDVPRAVFQSFDGVCKLLTTVATPASVTDNGCNYVPESMTGSTTILND